MRSWRRFQDLPYYLEGETLTGRKACLAIFENAEGGSRPYYFTSKEIAIDKARNAKYRGYDPEGHGVEGASWQAYLERHGNDYA